MAREDARALATAAQAQVKDALDRQLSPLGLAAMAALDPRPGERILDVGCGVGRTPLQLAKRVGPKGEVVGLDIAPALLAIARKQAAGLDYVRFVEGDAQFVDLPDGRFDGLFSRFGVMAFADLAAAFANLRRALKPGGRLAFVCWRGLEENELDALPLRATGLQSRVDRTPFSLEDPDHIRHVLATAGFGEIGVEAHDQAVCCGGIEATLSVLLTVGALGRVLRESPSLQPKAEPAVRQALEARQGEDGVKLSAATWIVTARA